jgi:predicted glycosyltransferase
MKIFIDIGHPAHVHYFKNFIWAMQAKGHRILITARDKEVTFKLLEYYQIPYLNRGKGRKGFFGKMGYILEANLFLRKHALKFQPDIFLSFGSPYAAQAAWLMGKPHIAFDDTDNNIFEHIMYVPFTKAILTPSFYKKDHGPKQIRFDGFMELCSLHPNRYGIVQDGQKKKLLNDTSEKYIILRFVSWEASHDMGHSGLSMNDKYALVNELSKYAKVVISSETALPDDLKKYGYSVHPALMHEMLAGASLLVSESLTMSAESAFLGTPTLCISTARAGTLDEEVKLGLIELFRTSTGVIERALEIMKDENYSKKFKLKTDEIVQKMTDVTGLMIWFVENFPKSFETIKNNPDQENQFKNTQIKVQSK